ncbi:MAG: hypothetical protein KGL54_07505 [Sphingomonadales bacterium]|nr:hypothetical protein [Sphingomonadales bacterium]
MIVPLSSRRGVVSSRISSSSSEKPVIGADGAAIPEVFGPEVFRLVVVGLIAGCAVAAAAGLAKEAGGGGWTGPAEGASTARDGTGAGRGSGSIGGMVCAAALEEARSAGCHAVTGPGDGSVGLSGAASGPAEAEAEASGSGSA